MPIKGLKGGVGSKALGYGLGGAAEEATDAEFNNTVLLLHGDGTEGAGDTANLGSPSYKALEDASSNNHEILLGSAAATSAIGPYGNDFSPYYYADGYWSNSFTADSLKVTTASDFDLSSSQEFSIEFWLHPTAINASWGIFFYANPNDNNFQISHDSSGNIDLRFAGSQIGTPFNLPLNTWSHFVITRDSSGYIRQFLDGVLKNYNQKTDAIDRDFVCIGDRNGGNHFLGYISNVRWVKDSIPTTYQTSETSTGTTVFTSPTAPVTTSSQGATSADVKLLTCQSNRFKDTSNNQTFTFNGAPKVSTNTPFTVTKTANVGSVFFDGDEDVVFVEENSSEFTYGTGDYEFSCWVYRTVDDVQQTLFGRDNTGDVNVPYVYITSGNKFAVYYTSSTNFSATADVPLNAWCHLVASRVSGTLKFFQDGAEVGSSSDGTTLIASTKVSVGGQHTGNNNMYTGYIADARVRKGTGVTSVTVPTTTITAETGTELLTCQYSGAVRNVGVVDDSKYNHQIIRHGDTPIGTFSPFSVEEGYWSNYFDGDAYHLVPDSDEHNFGTGDFTIEMFIYPQETFGHFIYLSAPNGTTTQFGYSSTKYLHGYLNNSDTIKNTDGVPENSVILNQWNHIVLERSGTNLSILSNGTRHATVTYSSAVDFSNLNINRYHGGGYEQVTYISNLRIVKGSAVYDADSYTVPTAPLTAIAGTTLLTCQSNGFIDNSTTGHTITPYNGSEVQPFSPFAPSRSYSKDAVGGSAYFDNNGDYLETAASNSLDFNDNQFCIEWWEYRTRRSSFDTVMHIGFNASTSYGLVIGYSGNLLYWSTGTSSWDVLNGVNFFGSETRHNNQWYHCVLTRDSSNQFRSFINGVLRYTTSVGSSGMYQAANVISIGSSQSHAANQDYEGYLSGININNGSIPSRYQTSSTTVDTSIFTSPTAPTTPDTDTVLLLNYANVGIIDHTMKNNLETEGNTRISGQQIKFGTGSIYFDSDDYMYIADSPLFIMGTGDFTFECFLYFTSAIGGSSSTYRVLISDATTNNNYLTIRGDTTDTNGVFQYNFNGSSANMSLGNGLTSNNWHHLAFSREGTTLRLYLNGTLTETDTSNTNSFNLNGNRGGVYVGAFNGPQHYLNGYMDEARLTKGVARYTGSSLTVPTQAFANR